MRIRNLFSFAAAAVVAVFAVGAYGQSDAATSAAGDKYVISAKAGGVNFVEGSVMIVKQNGRTGKLLKGDRVEVGDRVVTGSDGRVELLMNPGSFVRLDHNSAFRFKTTSLEDLQLLLENGSAMFEVYAANNFRVVVNVPKAKYTLLDTGVYRVDASAQGDSQLRVFRGKAHVGNVAGGEVKAGRSASITSGGLSIAKFDRDEKGSLENWSRSRAKELAKITSNLRRDSVRPMLISSFYGRGWNMYDSFGLWIWDPFYRTHCFMPFGYGWSSPYGFGFGRSLWYFDLPWYIYQNQPAPQPGPTQPNPGVIARPNTPSAVAPGSPNAGTISRPSTPAYVKFGGSDRPSPMNTGRGDISRPSAPIYAPAPMPAPAPPSAATKSRGQ